MTEKDKPNGRGKALRLSLAKPKAETPDARTIEAAEKLARGISPLAAELFNAESEKKKNGTKKDL